MSTYTLDPGRTPPIQGLRFDLAHRYTPCRSKPSTGDRMARGASFPRTRAGRRCHAPMRQSSPERRQPEALAHKIESGGRLLTEVWHSGEAGRDARWNRGCALSTASTQAGAGGHHRPKTSRRASIRSRDLPRPAAELRTSRIVFAHVGVGILKPKPEPEPNPNRPNYRSIRVFGFGFGSYICYISGYGFGFGS
jgi:hypothetical protein